MAEIIQVQKSLNLCLTRLICFENLNLMLKYRALINYLKRQGSYLISIRRFKFKLEDYFSGLGYERYGN